MGGAGAKVSADTVMCTYLLIPPPHSSPPSVSTTPKYLSFAEGGAFQRSLQLYTGTLAWMAGTSCPDLRTDLKAISTSIKSLYLGMDGRKGLLKVSFDHVGGGIAVGHSPYSTHAFFLSSLLLVLASGNG